MSERYAPNTGSGAYDLAVIGAGSAGFSAAITAAEQGAQVALIGHGDIGGTCVNIGCVPSKTLIRAAEALHGARTADRFAGLAGEARLMNWQVLIAQKDELVSGLRKTKYVDLLPAYNGIAYREGKARLENDGVNVDGETVRAGKIVITTGARPAVPDISGIDHVPYLTSTTALDLNSLPGSLLVLGGGYVGAELAQMFARAGVRVTVVFRSRLLPDAEPEISEALAGYLAKEGLALVKVDRYVSAAHGNGLTRLDAEKDGEPITIEAQYMLLATGRKPNSDGMGLEEAGVRLSPDGGIKVDERMRTTRKGVYAAGDVTGRDQFVYMAAYGAKIAAKNALNGDGLSYDNAAMPAVVFTDPQVASVGLTETGAKKIGLEVKTTALTLDNLARALVARDTRGLIKLVAEAGSGRLLGAHMLAPEGADSIQTAALAIRQGMTVTQLGEMIFPYLTTVEGLKLAAQTFNKDVAMLSCCAG